MNNFIVTNFGFIKGINFDKEHKQVIEYTDKLRYAQPFNNKAAKAFMFNNDIIGFIYNPYAEEPIRNMYEVKKRYCDFDDKDAVQEWIVKKAMMISESDVNFLQAKQLKSCDLLTLEEAQNKSIMLNQKMFDELNEKLLKQKENKIVIEYAVDGCNGSSVIDHSECNEYTCEHRKNKEFI